MFKINLNKNSLLLGIAVLGIIITAVLIYANQNPSQFSLSRLGFGLSNDAIAKKSLDYLNTTVLAGQAQATLVDVSEESGLVKIKIKIGTSEYDSYATKDGNLLFPQAFTMESAATAQQPSQNNQPSADQAQKAKDSITKSGNPVLEAYVVSRCPFGLQMQRAMADVVKNIPSLAQNMKVRYIGAVSGNTITSMHGDAEAKENLRQICIREEQPNKYWDYVSCQMKAGDTTGCETSTGVDSAKLNACASTQSRGVAYAQKDFDLDTKYNIQGSPTLIVGGASVSEFDFGGRSSDAIKSVVCSAFSSEPSSCSTKLNTAEAATSFSVAYAGSDAGSSGNSGANGANCAPAQ
ncbi:MAG: hypothetical protein US35_C0002G0027 [Parcubacteria group bacterium GW2011_GWA2_37_10]|nr:MAG: hypothetical protein US35_C0002G0027 [Parcubacteria group bacterium GW2011_GWA2_37_10]